MLKQKLENTMEAAPKQTMQQRLGKEIKIQRYQFKTFAEQC